MWLDQLQNQVFGFHGCSSPSPFGIWGVLLSPAGAVQVFLSLKRGHCPCLCAGFGNGHSHMMGGG